MEPQIELRCQVDRVLYPRDATGNDSTWYIIRTDQGTCKGKIPWRPVPMQKLILTGRYSVYQGQREFQIASAEIDVPTDPRAMLDYVCSRAKGIGEALADKIWQAKGEDWQILQDGDVPRISGAVYESFREALELTNSEKVESVQMAELCKMGLTQNMAQAAIAKWKNSAASVITSNPYRITELPGYGFVHADGAIRMRVGITDDDPRRIRAAVEYSMQQLTEHGSTLVRWDEFLSHSVNLIRGYRSEIISAVSVMMQDGSIKAWPETRSIALGSDHHHEEIIWNFLEKGAENVPA